MDKDEENPEEEISSGYPTRTSNQAKILITTIEGKTH